MHRHAAPERVFFLGVAGPRAILDPDYNGLILLQKEQTRIVEHYSELAASGRYPPLVVEHDPAQKIGIVRRLWVLSDGRLGMLGEIYGHAPMARDALTGKVLGLSVSWDHPYDKFDHRIVADRRIHHIGVVCNPCWDDQGTWIKDISNNLEKIENVFLQDYYKLATFMSQRDRAYWGKLLYQKQQPASKGFAEGEPTGIIYLRTGFSKGSVPEFVPMSTEPMDATLPPPQTTTDWSAMAKEYGTTPDQIRALLEGSKSAGIRPEEALELAVKKRREDAEAEERRAKEEREKRQEENRRWIDMHGPYTSEDDMIFMSKSWASESLNANDLSRIMRIQTNASKALAEATDHRKQEELFQVERAKREAEAQARSAKEALEASKLRRDAVVAENKTNAAAHDGMDYTQYYKDIMSKKKQEAEAKQEQQVHVDMINTTASKSQAHLTPAFESLSRMYGGIPIDRFDGSKFNAVAARGVDPSMFSSREGSLGKMLSSGADINPNVYFVNASPVN